MVWQPIDINPPLFSNLKDVSKTVVGAERHDVIKDLAGTTYGRPGLLTWVDGYGSLGCDGNYYWRHNDFLISIFDGDIYKTDVDGVKTLIESDLLEVGTPVTFAESSIPSHKLYMANGGKIIETDGSTAAALTDPDAPTRVTHVAILDTYLLANNLDEPDRLEYSEVGTPGSWAGEYVSAEGNPDKIKAVKVAWREIGIFGESTLENWYDDGSSPFSRIDGAMVEVGTVSPYSIKKANNSYYLLDTNKRIYRISGRQPIVVSQPVDDILGNVGDVSDAIGEVINQGGLTLYAVRVGERMIVYDFVRDEFVGEWNYFNDTTVGFVQATMIHERFRAQHFVNIDAWGFTVCGDYTTGKLYKFDPDTRQDFGSIIKSLWITGWIDHGLGVEKRSNQLRIKLKRGTGNPNNVEPELLVRWRDNGSKVWSNYRKIPLGFTGEDIFYQTINMLGSYRSRQYELSCTENVGIAIAGAEEDIEALQN
jgi:hypothetical protein